MLYTIILITLVVMPITMNDAEIRAGEITDVTGSHGESVIVQFQSRGLSTMIQYPVAKAAINLVNKIK